MVTARGAVDNLTDEPLENLSVEVSLKTGRRCVTGDAHGLRSLPTRCREGNVEPSSSNTMAKRDTGYAGLHDHQAAQQRN